MRLKNHIILFLLACLAQSAAAQLSSPSLSVAPGYYPDSIFVGVSSTDAGVSFHYTLNGDEPTQLSPSYSLPILIRTRAGQLNTFSMVPTNPSFSYPVNGYDSLRAQTRGWLPPYSEVFKASVLKVKAFRTGSLPSATTVATYFIGPLLSSRYSFPVISITSDSVNFFSDSAGIYVYGLDTASFGNYSSGMKKKAHVQLFETDGSLKMSQYCEVKTYGGGGRHAPQKSLMFSAKSVYGPDSFALDIFPGEGHSEFKNFVLRNKGHRPECVPRDDLAGRIAADMRFEVQRFRHVITFVNGEYWGFQSIKNLMDEHHFAEKYSLDKSRVAVLEMDGVVDHGLSSDAAHYISMRNYAASNDLTVSANYNYMKTQMDVDNFIDYQAAEIYFGNGDWPDNNLKYWRYRNSYSPAGAESRDGRWRWIMYDMDASFGGDCSGVYYTYHGLLAATDPWEGNYTVLLRSLLTNTEFRELFINRSADLLNSQFKSTRVRPMAAALDAEITPEMMENVERWRYPSVATTLAARATEVPSLTRWTSINTGLQSFLFRRPKKVREHYMSYFSLSDTADVSLNVSDTLAGRIRISTLIIDENTPGISGPSYPWTGKYFTGIPVPLRAIARPGYKFLNWQGTSITNPDTIVILNSDTSFTAVFGVDSSFQAFHHLFLNELSAKNTSFQDEYGQTNDWFEIYNPNNYPVDIDGYYVTDTLGSRRKFRFQSGSAKTIIPARGFLLVWADEQSEQGALHTSFRLSAAGEALMLVLPDGQTVVDSIIYGAQSEGISWGRQRDGDSLWVSFNSPTPGRSNSEQNSVPIDESIPLLAYPNPAYVSDKLFFNKPVALEMFDYLGRKVLQSERTMFISIPGINPGVYLIRTDRGEVIRWVKL